MNNYFYVKEVIQALASIAKNEEGLEYSQLNQKDFFYNQYKIILKVEKDIKKWKQRTRNFYFREKRKV